MEELVTAVAMIFGPMLRGRGGGWLRRATEGQAAVGANRQDRL